jgi:hypothetical protein
MANALREKQKNANLKAATTLSHCGSTSSIHKETDHTQVRPAIYTKKHTISK